MGNDAEFDRAIMHEPAVILTLTETHRLADQRLAQIDLGTAPADRTIAMDAPHARRGRVFGLPQNPIPRRTRVISCRRSVAERGMRSLLVLNALKASLPLATLRWHTERVDY